jgi:DNA (cytosine-5)-methyltransferase 1
MISLFTGAGGLDYGLEAAGFDTAVAVEMDAASCRTLRHNRTWPVIEDRIENVSSNTILRFGSLRKKHVDLLIGGPPCQPFSKSGFWQTGETKRLKDPRAKTLHHYLRVLEDTLPRAFVLENVFGLAYEGKDEGLRFIEKRLSEINRKTGSNYSFSWDVLNAADFGVPQVRERVFVVGHRSGKVFDFPEPRFYDPQKETGNKMGGLKPYHTAWDALGHLSGVADPKETALSGRYSKILPTIPEGQNYLFHTERGDGIPLFRWRSRYWSFLLKLSKSRPSWTIQANPGPAIGPFHWENRRLSGKEMAALQTFPLDVQILGNRGEVQKQIGNAVPSAIGELLGLELRRQFFGESIDSKELTLLPKRRRKPTRSDEILTLDRRQLMRLIEKG